MTLALLSGVIIAKARQVRARYTYTGKHWPIG